MKDWFFQALVNWLLANLDKEKLDWIAEKIKSYCIPFARDFKDKLIAVLRVAAKRSDNALDDALVDALDHLLDAFLPDNPEHFHG